MRIQYVICGVLPIVAFNLFAQSSNKPNIVFILVDDMGWKDLSC
ncbi:MAG: hypothetical protein Q7U47_03175 [Paludibacter sp.]|nr:hypothetical protein [Paludibacter sp.]